VSYAPWSELVTEERIAELHAASVERHGGGRGVAKHGCVDGSLGAAWNAEQYLMEEGGMPGLVFAGHLLFYLARNHCFVDGNKRAAWLAATEVLLKMDLDVAAALPEALAFMEDVAKGVVERPEQAVLWLADHLSAIGGDVQ
jgi:death on curing protein